MTVKDLIIYPNPLLTQISKPVTDFGAATQQLIQDMFDTMAVAEGIGLAAIQIGVPLRVIVTKIEEPLVLINPQLTILDRQLFNYEEGCLSIPEVRAEVKRPRQIRVRAQNKAGEYFELEAAELLSICIQHEVDHLDGKLFIHRLSSLEKKKIQPELNALLLAKRG